MGILRARPNRRPPAPRVWRHATSCSMQSTGWRRRSVLSVFPEVASAALPSLWGPCKGSPNMDFLAN